MKTKVVILISVICVVLVSGFFVFAQLRQRLVSPIAPAKKEKPLDKYTFSRLAKTVFPQSHIIIGKQTQKEEAFVRAPFYFKDGSKKVSGVITAPAAPGIYPIVVQFRGFVPKENYFPGNGTARSAELFAKNGFISLSPDFLGFGESDLPSLNSIEERFQTYTTGLSLLASLPTLNSALEATTSAGAARADVNRVGIWGHSNGGHIALSLLAITGKNYPTVLWAPVSKPFPYSILFFTDEFEDNGKALRKVVADFENDYDIEKYSPTNYYSQITAPLQIHQGGADEAVPIRWSDQLVTVLKGVGVEAIYYTYSQDDHNFSKGNWSTVMLRSLDFYLKNFKE